MMEWADNVAYVRKKKLHILFFVGRSERKRLFKYQGFEVE
jgi:hypothetical protein